MEMLEVAKSFFGWCTLINFVILAFAGFALIFMRTSIVQIHQAFFGLDEKQLLPIYFKYLAYYKIAIVVFSLTPFLALSVML